MKNEKLLLNAKISIIDFKNFYWYKKELVDFCSSINLDKSGSKIDLTKRIEHFLETGERIVLPKKKQSLSKFDWNNAPLSLQTKITDNYKNTENVRTFFKHQIGLQFKFNVKFMNWMKNAQGNTLEEAIEKWYLIANDNTKTQIAPQFEYNTYIRDFLNDNPDKVLKDAIKHWKIKKSKAGDNKYNKTDLQL
ncbi:DUF6434 domain-containing protein [Flammeovirga sp. SJP92]|uniref:DUF6434 domain-containing protein n=1 Tax=Flammeovirga sp. SJP92 TaxID=1775430 RepID=UPI00078958CC|nr:DUF6434 domain-containing protein [Flammeovirga sp. SJP92]KXX66892.1 hypothetical protein AVL50_30650 [Flammeovirga sp. SJP92]